MMRTTWLIRTAACVAAIAATGAAHAADGELLAQSQVRGSQVDPPCRGAGLSHAPLGGGEQAPVQLQSAKQLLAGGYASPKDVKLVFACRSRLVPRV
jgi:hypothetical protein